MHGKSYYIVQDAAPEEQWSRERAYLRFRELRSRGDAASLIERIYHKGALVVERTLLTTKGGRG